MENTDNKKTVLAIDDDPNLRNVLIDKLIASGFNAFGAVDGEDGLKKAIEIQPDLILLDIIMPKLSGWEMLDLLRKDPWGKNAKVIMLTVLESLNVVAGGAERNIIGYIIKSSVSLDEIVSQVKDALKIK